jgi:hypothetical protein
MKNEQMLSYILYSAFFILKYPGALEKCSMREEPGVVKQP